MPDVAVKQSVKLVNELADPKLTAVTLNVRTLWRGTGYLGESTSFQTPEATRLLHDVY